jgi:large subunit ribosomal protein LP0
LYTLGITLTIRNLHPINNMPAVKKSAKRIQKESVWRNLQSLAFKYKNALFVDANNVSSKQISMLRQKLRAIDAQMIMGKNTLMKAALKASMKKPEAGDSDYEDRKDEWYQNDNIPKIIDQLVLNTNIIFTNGDLSKIKDILDSEARPSAAKPGMIAPAEVTVPAGPTGLDPKQTSFFQTLQIQTKIVKAQIEIVTEKQVIWVGDKIGATEAALLDKLKIYPFEYKMHVRKVLQNGSVFDAAVLEISSDDILAKFRKAINNQASAGLGLGVPNKASAPHTILNGFKNLVAVSAMSGFEFPQAKKMLDAAKNAPAAGAPAAAAAGGAKAAAEPEKEEEEENVDMGGLFGDEDDGY